jgi:hypothetical protein
VRSLGSVVLACTLLLAACTPQEAEEWQRGPAPRCDTTSRGRLLLVAQSVPGATLIPCIGDLPPGWRLTHASSETDESSLRFTTDTFDLDVDVVLTPECDVSAGTELDSPRANTRLHAAADGRTFSYTFTGGCIAFVYESAQLAASSHGRDFMEGVPFMTRGELRRVSGWKL